MVNTCDHKDLCVKLCLEKISGILNGPELVAFCGHQGHIGCFLYGKIKKIIQNAHGRENLGKFPCSEWTVRARWGWEVPVAPLPHWGSACARPGSGRGTSSPQLGNLTKTISLDLSNTPDCSGLSQDETFHSCSGKKLKHVLKAEFKDVCKEARWQWSPIPVQWDWELWLSG